MVFVYCILCIVRGTGYSCAAQHNTTLPRYLLVLGLIDQLVLTDPRHHVTQLAADHFDWMFRIQTTTGSHLRVIGAAFENELFGI